MHKPTYAQHILPFLLFVVTVLLSGCYGLQREIPDSATTPSVAVGPCETVATTGPFNEEPSPIIITPEPTQSTSIIEAPVTEPVSEAPIDRIETTTAPEDSVTFQPVDETVYAKTDVNIRKGPGTEYDKITYLPAGDSVRRIGIGSNGWSKVIFQGREAYISSSYLTNKKPSDNIAPPATEPPATVAPTVTPTEPLATMPPADVPTSPEEPHTHNYSANKIHFPTCESDGYTVYTCSCGDSYHSDIIVAAGHNWGDWVETVAATVDSEGEQVRTCKNCQATETQPIPKKEAEKIDTAVLTAYGNNYAASLGFTLDYSVRDGYFPPDTIIFTTMAAAKSNVAANVDVLYNSLMAADGSIEGYRVCVTVVDNGNGTYTTTVYYG